MPQSPKRRNHRGAGSHLPPLVDLRLAKGLGHVLRQHILLAATQREVSPKGLAGELGEDLSQVAYHVKVLREDCDGLLKETRRRPVRGALEHYYRADAKTLLSAEAWRRLKDGMRAVVGAGQASDLFNDLAAALEAGKLRNSDDCVHRVPLRLDSEGRERVRSIAERATAEVEDEQRAAGARMAEGGGNGDQATMLVFSLLFFEMAWTG